MPLTENQIADVEKLIGEGQDSHQIADKLSVSFYSVAGIRARITRSLSEK
jgi:FixJ family two-component response regulator